MHDSEPLLSKTSNINIIYSELGFSEELSKSEFTKFKRCLRTFRTKFVDQDNSLPAITKRGPRIKAERCALAFCSANDQARDFWSNSDYQKGLLSWPIDREKYVNTLFFTYEQWPES